jgi:hypothetical protein
MDAKRWKEQSLFFLLGILFIIVVMFLTGATNGPQIGRYQIDTTIRGQFVETMIVDTATGRVKNVNQKNENKPFEEIK